MTRYLLKAGEISEMLGSSEAHPVNKNVERTVKSLGDATGLTGIGVNIFETAPGAETTAFHAHHFEDEALFVLSGTAVAEIGDEHHDIGPGDFLGYRKGGLPHIIRNTGSEPLRCLVMGERSDHDVIDYPRAGKRLFNTVGLPSVYVDLDPEPED
ncbi:MAG: cupin domain-containing protein [Pseudomonadota bacterium]